MNGIQQHCTSTISTLFPCAGPSRSSLPGIPKRSVSVDWTGTWGPVKGPLQRSKSVPPVMGGLKPRTVQPKRNMSKLVSAAQTPRPGSPPPEGIPSGMAVPGQVRGSFEYLMQQIKSNYATDDAGVLIPEVFKVPLCSSGLAPTPGPVLSLSACHDNKHSDKQSDGYVCSDNHSIAPAQYVSCGAGCCFVCICVTGGFGAFPNQLFRIVDGAFASNLEC